MRIFESGRSLFNTLTTAAFLLVGLAGWSIQASAQLVQCIGTDTVTFNPAMTNTAQTLQVGIGSNFSSCLGDSSVPSGTSDYSIERTYSCSALLQGGPGSRVITWSNGQTSTFSYTATTEVSELGEVVLTLTGNISAGLFQDQSAEQVSVLTNLGEPDFATACMGSGVTQLSGPTTLTILPAL